LPQRSPTCLPTWWVRSAGFQPELRSGCRGGAGRAGLEPAVSQVFNLTGRGTCSNATIVGSFNDSRSASWSQEPWFVVQALACRRRPRQAKAWTTNHRFMKSEERRRQCLIVPMNLGDSGSVAAACSVAARGSGAFVPAGKIRSDTRQDDCLVTLGASAGRNAGAPSVAHPADSSVTLVGARLHLAVGRGLCLLWPKLAPATPPKSPICSASFAMNGSWKGKTSKFRRELGP
jgi:hypothetical protein